jgi:AcrR family transcriptional regulator
MTISMPPSLTPLPLLEPDNALPVLDEPHERADAARNRRRILAAAERLLQKRSVQCISMDAIAEAAGVGKGTLFRRFGDRAGLLRALLDDRERAFQDGFIRGAPPLGPGAPARERLVAFGHSLLEMTELRGDLVMAAETGEPDLRLRGLIYGTYRAHVSALLREAAPRIDVEYAADALLGPLAVGVVLHQLRTRNMSMQRVKDGWEQLVAAVVACPPRG